MIKEFEHHHLGFLKITKLGIRDSHVARRNGLLSLLSCEPSLIAVNLFFLPSLVNYVFVLFCSVFFSFLFFYFPR